VSHPFSLFTPTLLLFLFYFFVFFFWEGDWDLVPDFFFFFVFSSFRIAEEARKTGTPGMVVEIGTQDTTGSHRFDFVGRVALKM